MIVHYGFGNTLFGSAFLALSENKILSLSFISQEASQKELEKLKTKWPQADFKEASRSWAQKNLNSLLPQAFPFEKIKFEMAPQGTEFQNKVWKLLQKIPPGTTLTYSEIAQKIGHPKAVRAVGSAVGANPIAYLIPCHRVLPKGGGVGQFAWGPELKKRMLLFEEYHII